MMGWIGARRSLWVFAMTAVVAGLLGVAAPAASAKTATSISAGGDHTCAVTVAGGVLCWGGNWLGQVGDGTTDDRLIPVQVSGLVNGIQAVAAGGDHTCALTTDGGVKCWGFNRSGQLGDGTTADRYTPVDVVGLASGVSAVAAGSYHTCALTTDGGVKCWGSNFEGRLGDGTWIDSPTPVAVAGLTSGVVAIAAGHSFTCALTSEGGVKCWGGMPVYSSTPVDIPGLTSEIAAVTTGGTHACALTTEGGMRCWGENFRGQLGVGTFSRGLSDPGDVVGLTSGVVSISAGSSHTCAVTTGAVVKCWGANGGGMVGDATTVDRSAPVDVAGLWVPVEALSAGGPQTCAITSGGGVLCWGQNTYGEVGDGSTTMRTSPVAVTGLGGTSVTPGCSARLVRTGTTYRSVQVAVNAARDADVVRIEGVCVGSITIARKKLVLEGIRTAKAPVPVLSGAQVGRVLAITGGRVTLRSLTLAFGKAPTGGGIRQTGGSLTLAGDTSVLWGAADQGGGIWTSGGELVLKGSASVRNSSGGGIHSERGTVTLEGSAAVAGNTAGDGARGGGIYNGGGTVALRDSASVSDNALGDGASGGGIYNDGGTVTLGDTASMTANTIGTSSKGGAIFNLAGIVAIHGSSTIRGVHPNMIPPPSVPARGSGIENIRGHLIVDGRSRIGKEPREYGGDPSWFGYKVGIENVRGTVSMSEGAWVIGNGVGIANDSGAVRLRGWASIRRNGESGIVNTLGTVTMEGSASLRSNEAAFGGGIHNEGGTVSMSGKASIRSNTGWGSGGGIYNGQRGRVSLHDSASISDGWTRDMGGGIRNVSGGVVSLFDSASVFGNRAAHYGGGISNGPHGSVFLSGSASVVQNLASREHGGIGGGTVYVCSDTVAISPNAPDDPPRTSPCPD